ncbi:hypothetical protein [Chamaesiphon polymorphus]|nr:hypothetical protein [Chamaesiphon polymorphus]
MAIVSIDRIESSIEDRYSPSCLVTIVDLYKHLLMFRPEVHMVRVCLKIP